MNGHSKRAHASEQALKEEKDLLEIKVEERTAELKRSQAENISQFSRFAEIGRLSSGLFHDLIGPLASVAMNLSGLEGSVHADMNEIKDQVDRAIKASRRMDTFIGAVRKQIRGGRIRGTLFDQSLDRRSPISLQLQCDKRRHHDGLRC